MSSQTVDLSPEAGQYVVSCASTVNYDRSTKTFCREAVVFLIETADGSRCTAETKTHILTSIRGALEMASYLRDTMLPSMTTDDEKDGWSNCVSALVHEQPMVVPSPLGGMLILPTLSEGYTYRHSALDKSAFDILVSDGLQERVLFTSTEQGAFQPESRTTLHSLARFMSTEAFEQHQWPELLHDYPQEMGWFVETIEQSKVLELAVMALSSVALGKIMDEKERDA